MAAPALSQLHRALNKKDQPSVDGQLLQHIIKPTTRHRNPLHQEQKSQQLRRPTLINQKEIHLLHLSLLE